MVPPQVLIVLLTAALTFWAGEQVVKGVKHVGHDLKRAGIALVHKLKAT